MARILFPKGDVLSSPFGEFYFSHKGNQICGMLTIAEIRRARLEQLITRYDGKVASLNEALGLERTSAKLSRIRNANLRNEREGKPYQMGDALAREIEDALKIERGWMDSPPGYELMANARIRHVLKVMETMPEYKIDQAIKIIDTIAEPAPRRGNGDAN